MKKINWSVILLVLNLAIVSGVVLFYMNFRYPMAGHDYSGLSWLLETYLHTRMSGLGIQWYAPNFGGGLPIYPDPNSGQFTLIQLLVFFVSPWWAVLISTVIFIVLGGLAGYCFFNRVLKLHWTSSILGTVFFSATGYYLQRMTVGHLNYQTFPLIAVLLFILLDSSIFRWAAGLIFAAVVALIIYQMGYLYIIIFGFSFLIIFPLLYIYRPELISWKRIISVIALGGTVALIISASKLAAVYAYMRFFPRLISDTVPGVGVFQGLLGIVVQLLGTMNLAPLMALGGISPARLVDYQITIAGSPHGYWEFDMSMSPVVFALLIFGFYTLVRRPKRYPNLFKGNRKWFAWGMLLFFTWLTIEFILAKGLMYPLLSRLPILSSLHVNPRYTVALIFPLAILSALIYDKWIPKWSEVRSARIFLAVNLLALIPLSAYFLIPDDPGIRLYDLTESEQIYAAIRAGSTFDITAIGDSSVSNTQALGRGLSNPLPYNPIFGYDLENLHTEIKPGSIWEITDGYYNMTNPSGYVFPEINGTHPFERIPVSQKAQLEAFASHRDPGWKIPLYQKVLDWVSGLTAVGVGGFLAFAALRQLARRFLGRR